MSAKTVFLGLFTLLFIVLTFKLAIWHPSNHLERRSKAANDWLPSQPAPSHAGTVNGKLPKRTLAPDSAIEAFKIGTQYEQKYDYPAAARWYRLAAEPGLAQAQFKLGVILSQGIGLSKDRPQAIQWLLKAANQGQAEAKQQLMILQAQVPQLIAAEKYQAAFEIAAAFDTPQLQKLAASAKQKMRVVLTELQHWFAKGDYDRVITQGAPKIKYGDEIKQLVEKALAVQAARNKMSLLLKENKLQKAIDVASRFDIPELQALAARAKSQLNIALTELQHLFAKGDYKGVITTGQAKMVFSDELKKLVDSAHQKLINQKREQIRAAFKATLEKKSVQPQSITIAVIGDSLADGIWGAIYRELRHNKQITVLRETVTSSGLTAFKWQNKVEQLLNQQRFHIAVILMGTNDGQSLLLSNSKQRLSYNSEQWKTVYVQRVNQLMGLLEANKIPTYWVGLPAVRRHNMVDQVLMLNRFYQESAASFAAMRYLPIWHLTVNNKGKYSAYGLDKSGRKRLLRAADGVHFSKRGYELLAHYILKHIYEDLPVLNR
ncbi:MAG: hypothetical protein DRR19_16595 [Candidatus Parabeggiatoa sp. nov. 1]|nr:MAG: hypothetical protein DRR19_16595 [Gammaproteobacteria bacterium]